MKDIDRENSPFEEPVEIEISDSIDLHAFKPSEVARVVRTYLDEAAKADLKIVKIIHGKGIGVQREIVRKILSEHDAVESFKNGSEFSGSWGATLAVLK